MTHATHIGKALSEQMDGLSTRLPGICEYVLYLSFSKHFKQRRTQACKVYEKLARGYSMFTMRG